MCVFFEGEQMPSYKLAYINKQEIIIEVKDHLNSERAGYQNRKAANSIDVKCVCEMAFRCKFQDIQLDLLQQ